MGNVAATVNEEKYGKGAKASGPLWKKAEKEGKSRLKVKATSSIHAVLAKGRKGNGRDGAEGGGSQQRRVSQQKTQVQIYGGKEGGGESEKERTRRKRKASGIQ